VAGTEKTTLTAVRQVRSLRTLIGQWKQAHEGGEPDFAGFPRWQQFTAPEGRARPLLHRAPTNPFNGFEQVAVVPSGVKPGDTGGDNIGWVYDAEEAKLWATDASGKVFDDSTVDLLAVSARPSKDGARGGSGTNVQIVRAQVSLYKSQHNNELPDLAKYPNWEQLTGKTGVDGSPDSGGKYGPYLGKPPVGRNGSSAVEVVHKVTTGHRPAKKVGFVLETSTGKVWLVDAQGAVIGD
jgi:hypothetical protein